MKNESGGSTPSLGEEWMRLREMGKAGDVEGLVGELRNPRSKEREDGGPPFTVREEALRRLVKLRDPQSVEPIRHLLDDPLPSLRSDAARALATLGDRESIPRLVSALDDPDEMVRWNTAGSLGKLRAREAVPGLVAALEDENEWVRLSAALALGKIGDRSAIGPLKELRRRERGRPVRRLKIARALLSLRLKR